jgi:tetratricopeptide (TPR) repeat protein
MESQESPPQAQPQPPQAQPQEPTPGRHWYQWRPHFNWLKLDVPREQAVLRRGPLFLAFALMVVGLAVVVVPAHVDSAALGALTDGPGSPGVPTLCFLVGDVCLAIGVWTAVIAAHGRPVERLAVTGLGVVSAALAGQCTRLVWQIVLLRGFYRPALFTTSPQRAAAVGWGMLLTAVLTAGFLGPLLVAAANLLPRFLANAVPPIRWLAARRWWLLLPFAGLAATVIITQWVLPSSLAAAMGYREPGTLGGTLTISLRDLGPAAWSSLQILFALPLLVLMWEGIEAARTSQRLVRKPDDGAVTALLTRVQRIDYRIGAAAVVIAAGWFAVVKGAGLTALASVGLFVVIALSLGGDLGRVARLAKGFERAVRKWGLPEEWRDLGRISLVLAILVFPVLIVVGANIVIGAKSGLLFPWDLDGFYFYWHSYGLVTIPVVTAAAIYGHVEGVVWIVCAALAGLTLFGMLIQMFRKEVRGGFRVIWFLLRVAALAFLLAPVARLADHPYATFVLAGGAVVAILLTSVVTSRQQALPAGIWSAILIGGALTLWSLALWYTDWLPGALALGLTIVQRFVYNAGNLNDPDKYRPNRVAYFQAVALVSVGMLVLGHGASGGYFESDALSAVSDRVSLSVVAVIWLVMLVVLRMPRAGMPETAKEVPRHWAGLLDPHRALVGFAGRESELAALRAWCEDPGAERLRLVAGCGGVGKTRLAVELAHRLAGEGWSTVWVPAGEETAAVRAAQAVPHQRALLALDRAASRTQLGQAVQALMSAPAGQVRVLLLARTTGTWCDQMGCGSPAAASLVRLAQQRQLRLSIPVVQGTRDFLIAAGAAKAIIKEFGLREKKLEGRNHKNASRQRILDLHAAALAATLTDASLTDGGTGTVQMDLRTGPAQLLGHEREFWYAAAAAHGGPDARDEAVTRPLRQIMAACFLLGATTADEAAALAALVPGLPAGLQVTPWLGELFGQAGHGPDGAAILPARLAALHTVPELARDEFAAACLTGMSTRQAIHAVAFLAEAVTDYKEASAFLRDRLLPTLAGRIPEPASRAEALAAAVSLLPYPEASFAEAAAGVIRQLLECLPLRAEPNARAYWLSQLASRLAEAGELTQALATEQEAVMIHGQLAVAGQRDDRAGYAASLGTLSERLKQTGHSGDALAAAREAIGIYQELAGADPAAYRPALAQALTDLSVFYYERDDLQECLVTAGRAAVAYRELAAASPGQYNPGLGRALTTLALRYNQMERFADAVPIAEEGIGVYRQLVSADPSRYNPGLAEALDNLGIYLSKTGRPQEALPATKEAVSLYQQLAKINPERYRPRLARAQGNLRYRHQELSRTSRR